VESDEKLTTLLWSSTIDPLAALARLSNMERLHALWRRKGIVRDFAEEYRRELIAHTSDECLDGFATQGEKHKRAEGRR